MSHSFQTHWWLRNGLVMTVYSAKIAFRLWERTIALPEPPYQDHIFIGADSVPIFGMLAVPENPRGTIIGTYGITGNLDNQWFLRLLGRKAFAKGYAVVLFDWRAHGKTAQLSPTLTSDGLYEGEDFVRIAAGAKQLGCPAPFWFTGFSLGGQLALWGVKAAQTLGKWGKNLALASEEIAGGAVICPNLDSNRSLSYLMKDPWGRYLERAIAAELKKLAWQIYQYHPEAIAPEAIARANSIADFDRQLVIEKLGFSSVEDYYEAVNVLYLLPELRKATLILYAADDPLFSPSIIPDLQAICAQNQAIDLVLSDRGGHVGYISNRACQHRAEDADCWWGWNRVLEWCDRQLEVQSSRISSQNYVSI